MTWTVGVVTTSRADYGIYQPVLDAIVAAPDMKLALYVGGMHLSPEFGSTVDQVEADGYPIADRLESLLSSDSEEGIASSMGLTTMRFATALARKRPDVLMILGDRYEMHAAATAAVPLRIPLVHLHGGEETENAIDNVLRHSMSKLANLHFTSTEAARARLLSMGEAPDRVIRSGAPALDGMASEDLLARDALGATFGFPSGRYLLVTFHPETLDPEGAIGALEKVWTALTPKDHGLVFTQANADAGGRVINAWLAEKCGASKGQAILVGTLGRRGYFSAMRHADAMVGNSSSGIIEAASFGLPVVNIGDRQKGRERSPNTLDVAADTAAIAAAVERALSAQFRQTAETCRNVYGDGKAALRIVDGLRAFLASGAPLAKPFVAG